MALRIAVVTLVLAAGCAGDPFSEVVVVIDAGEMIQRQAESVRVLLWSGDMPPDDGSLDAPLYDPIVFTVGPGGETDFPILVGVSPMGNDASRRFRVEAAALRPESETVPIAVARASTGFVSGEIRQLYLYLDDDCIDVECEAPLSCRDGRCLNADIDAATLSPHGVTGCGNAELEGSELCDDGNLRDGDGCSAACEPEGSCEAPIDVELAGASFSDGSIAVYGSTTDGTDHAEGSCVSAPLGKDVVYRFVSDVDGRIEASTEGGAIWPTVLYARTDCDVAGSEIDCQPEETSSPPRITADVRAGEPVYLFVDGANESAGGDFRLTLRMVGGPGTDCENPIPITVGADGTFQATGTTIGTLDDASGTCGGDGAPDVVFRLDPTESGRVRVSTEGSPIGLSTAVYARTACDDAATEISCNAGVGGSAGSRLTFPVTGTDPIFIFMDGRTATQLGDYVLDVFYAPDDVPGTCDNPIPITLDEDGAFTDTNSTELAFDDLASSCGGDGAAERVYVFTPPPGAEGRFLASTENSPVGFSTTLHARVGACGPGVTERSCNAGVGGSASARIQGYLNAGEELYLAVDGRGTGFGDYQLDFRFEQSPPGSCDAPTPLVLSEMSDVMVSGSTVDGWDDGGGTCGGETSFDAVYSVGIPEAGRVGVSTTPSAGYSTVLHARTDCGDVGTERGCNAGVAGSAGSTLEILGVVEPLFLFVDGRSGLASGDYDLEAWFEPNSAEGTCTVPKEIPVSDSSTTLDSESTFHRFDDTEGMCGGDGNPDFAYRVMPTSAGSLTATVTTRGTWTPTLYIGAMDCTTAAGAAECEVGTAGGSATVTRDVMAGTEYILVVDSDTATAGGDFDLTLELTAS